MMLPVEEQACQRTTARTAEQPTVIRTGRGLTIAGTRITLYQILDYVKAGWPPEQIQYLHRLTDEQMADTLGYIESQRAEVEAEYQIVLRRAEEIRSYWEERDRDRQAETAAMPAKPGQEELRAKLEVWKKRLFREP
jgi:uncharacterized protein (DUF433 family)